jgi:hypothetical protein
MFSKQLNRSAQKSFTRNFATMTKQVGDQIRALGITNTNIIYNPR